MNNKVLILLMLMCSALATMAAEKNAIYCWINGSSTCYRLSSNPVITYSDNAAVLTIAGVEQLRLPMEDISQLTITYGIYQDTPTNNEQAEPSTIVEKVGKYIRGGRLIIVKDGKVFDVEGR